MDNNNTTREQLIAELEKLRQRIAQLETLEVEHRLSLEVGHSEERLAGIIASITDHMSMMDEDHNIVWANTIAYDLFGSDLVGRKCYSAYHGYDKPCDACLVSKCFHDGEVHEHETKIIGADGTPMTFWCTASVAERNSNGRPKLVVEISRDITDRKRVEQDLRQYRSDLEKLVNERTSELQKANEQLRHEINERGKAEAKVREMANRFKTIFDSVNDVLTVIDKHHTVTEVNRYRLKVSGLTRQQVIGKKCYEVFQRQDTPCEICPAMPVFEKGEPVRLEKPVVAKDGTVKYFDAQGTPIFDDEGNIVEVISSARDITEKKQAEEALRVSARQWQTTFDAISDGVCLLERNRKILRCNKAMIKILGISPDEIIGATCWEVVHGATEPVEECPIVRMYETHRRATRVLTIDNRWYNVSVDPVLTESGEIAGAVHIMSNITSQKEAEEVKRKLATELQEVRKMQAIGTLAGGIAHDFNNLLMGIQGHISLMLVDVPSYHPHYDRLKVIEKQVQNGVKLTRQLLGYARKGRYEVKPIDLNKVVKESSATFARTRREVTVHRELAENVFVIEADQGQIEQALLNLYVNAADAMPGGGDLTLKTMNTTHDDMKDTVYDARPGRFVLLTVTDTGTGMDKEIRERIFEPFFTTKEMGGGTGLGLASVYGVIKGHDGHIHVDSEQGRGTTFSIYLPASDKKLETGVKPAEQIARGSGTVLIVDDEPIVLDVGAEMLEQMGFTTLKAMGGEEALSIYQKNKDTIDLVILDMVMPDMGGGEVYDRIKTINPGAKVLLSSGYSIDGQAKSILDRGCDGFLQKPFTLQQLSEKTKELLDG